MIIYLIISLTVALTYATVIVFFDQEWDSMVKYENGEEVTDLPLVTVIVVARNEARSVEACIKSLLHQDYPSELYKIMVLDNHSQDDTLEVARSTEGDHVQVIALGNHLPEEKTFKKESLAFGISKSESEWILTTDADCIISPTWISHMIRYAIKQKLQMVLGPVTTEAGHGFLEQYQCLDVSGLSITTAAGLSSGLLLSANGANMAFKKEVFMAASETRNDGDRASGDDIFLLQALFKKSPKQIGFLKSQGAIVRTKAESSWLSFYWQRKRWASKTTAFDHQPTKLITGLVFFNSLLIVLDFLLIPFLGIRVVAVLLLHLGIKSFAEQSLLRDGHRFFDHKLPIETRMLASLFNPAYIAIVGISSLISDTYKWKGRKTR